jgi:transposase
LLARRRTPDTLGAPGQRLLRRRISAERKQSAILRLLRVRISSWCRGDLGGTAAELSAWRSAFLAAGEASLKTRPANGRDVEIGRLKAKVGDLTNDQRAADDQDRAPGGRSPLARRRSRRVFTCDAACPSDR